MTYLPEKTVRYKTYVKTALVEALRPVFKNHLDEKLRNTNVTIDFPKERQSYPSVVIKFYEREISNAGVGHEEVLIDDDNNSWKFKHYFYNGDVEFSILALSSLDRDLISDTLVQTIAMGNLADYTNNFFNRIYPPNTSNIPDSVGHYININSDKINGFGENQNPVPWNSEDDLIYQVSYRSSIWGEFYSLPADVPLDFIKQVFLYPYTDDQTLPEGSENLNNWT